MLLDLLPELLSPILTLLRRKDLKNISLCSKECNLIVAPILWERVVVTKNRLLATSPIPNQMALCHRLYIDVSWCAMMSRKEEELVMKFAALMTLCSPKSFSFECSSRSLWSQCAAAMPKDKLEYLRGLKNFNIIVIPALG